MADPPDPRTRFSSRVADYVRARPGYPAAVVELLERACGLPAPARIADLGSGTGLLALPFLERGHEVVGVEPNAAMRDAGDALLARFPRFRSVAGSAEATTLPAASVDLAVAGQAYHWFDPPATARELRRVVRPGGWVAIVWNERLVDETPFLRAYEALLVEHGTDYALVDHRNADPALLGIPLARASFPNVQRLDRDGLRSRILSSSYTPAEDDPRRPALVRAIDAAFAEHAVDGHVEVVYRTDVRYGQVSPP